MTEQIEIRKNPLRKHNPTNFKCPDCGRMLPISSFTECDECGAHIEIHTKVTAPGVTDG
jgi:rRNA maturation endonuclease Nob1